MERQPIRSAAKLKRLDACPEDCRPVRPYTGLLTNFDQNIDCDAV
jgi:hypothetical protein